MNRSWIFVTDLDGTLLDHYSYSFSAARSALAAVHAQQIPLILNTSKTAAELMSLRSELAPDDPFIVENGSAIVLPEELFPKLPVDSNSSAGFKRIILGSAREEILEFLQPYRSRYAFTGFSDMTIDELVAATGLEETSARLAATREFSEPILWRDSDSARATLVAAARAAGFMTLQGGRFLHLLGNTDKGKASLKLKRLYQLQFGKSFDLAVFGDSQNDAAMLEVADIPVIIRSPVHSPPSITSNTKAIVSQRTGPQGWSDCVFNILNLSKVNSGATGNG